MQTENTYIETDLGNIALNPRGEYSDEASYEYLDTVSYKGGSYMCLAELKKTISGIAPVQGKNTEYWQILTLPGQLTSEAVAMHDDVVNKAKQVETSRAAVELSQQEVEAAQIDVSQMRQDTQEASQTAIASRDSAAGYAQSAEASRTGAKESEDNINAQVTGFDIHVAEKTSAMESAVEEARKTAIDAITTQQDTSTKAVTDEGTKQIKAAIKAVTTQQNNSVQAIADEASEQIKKIKDSLDKGLSEEGKAADAKATGEAISNLTEDLGEIEKSCFDVTEVSEHKKLEGLEENGYWINKNLNKESSTNAKNITFLDVTEGKTYRCTTVNGGNCPAIIWLDSNKKIVSYNYSQSQFVYESCDVIAPKNSISCIVNTLNANLGETKLEMIDSKKTYTPK